MRNPFILLLLLMSSLSSVGQEEPVHVPASKSLVGIWQQISYLDPSGKSIDQPTGNYKIINPDSTFYTFVVWGLSDHGKSSTRIGQYGTYEVTSDSTWTEHIVEHYLYKPLSGKDGWIKHELVDENTLIMAYSYDKKKWVKEKWRRLGN